MTEIAYPDIKVRPDPTDVVADLCLAQRPALVAAGLLEPGGWLENSVWLDRNAGTELPAVGLVGRLPFLLVTSLGSDTDRFGGVYDVDIAVFAGTYRAAKNLALGLEARLLGYPFRVSSGGRSVLVDRVTIPTPFAEVEWQKDSEVRRFQGTVQISIRR